MPCQSASRTVAGRTACTMRSRPGGCLAMTPIALPEPLRASHSRPWAYNSAASWAAERLCWIEAERMMRRSSWEAVPSGSLELTRRKLETLDGGSAVARGSATLRARPATSLPGPILARMSLPGIPQACSVPLGCNRGPSRPTLSRPNTTTPTTASAHTMTAPEGRSNQRRDRTDRSRSRAPRPHRTLGRRTRAAWRVASAGMISVAKTR